MFGGGVSFRGRLWVIGGGTYDTLDIPTRTFRSDVWSSSDGVTWQLETPDAFPARQYHNVAVFRDRLWVIGGWDGVANRNDVWFSADGRSWEEVPNTPWLSRHATSVYVHRDHLWIVTGSNLAADVWSLACDDSGASPDS
jgi:hypothetical protein